MLDGLQRPLLVRARASVLAVNSVRAVGHSEVPAMKAGDQILSTSHLSECELLPSSFVGADADDALIADRQLRAEERGDQAFARAQVSDVPSLPSRAAR